MNEPDPFNPRRAQGGRADTPPTERRWAGTVAIGGMLVATASSWAGYLL